VTEAVGVGVTEAVGVGSEASIVLPSIIVFPNSLMFAIIF
jgi:hypothetical protein